MTEPGSRNVLVLMMDWSAMIAMSSIKFFWIATCALDRAINKLFGCTLLVTVRRTEEFSSENFSIGNIYFHLFVYWTLMSANSLLVIPRKPF